MNAVLNCFRSSGVVQNCDPSRWIRCQSRFFCFTRSLVFNSASGLNGRRLELALGDPSDAKPYRLGDMDASGDEGVEGVVCSAAWAA